MMRWYSWGGHHLQIDDISAQFQPDPQVHAALDITMQCSIEDWKRENITPTLGSFAHRLTKRFLLTLARFDHQGRPINTCDLSVAHPSDRARASDPAHTLVAIDPTQQRRQRIEVRLDHFREYSGWLASDELGYALEGPRAMCTNTLFCAPATWNTQKEELMFLNNIVPEYAAFRNIFWMIVVNNHLRPCLAMMLRILLQLCLKVCGTLFDHLVHITEVDRLTLNCAFRCQISPPRMCGYHLLQQIFRRLEADQVALHESQVLQLTSSYRAALIQEEDKVVWQNSQASSTLCDFATATRGWFLVRVVENRFPEVYFAAGMYDEDDSMSGDMSKENKNQTSHSEKLEGPFEITVDDPSARLSYKRLISIIVVQGKVTFKLPDPVVKLTTPAICEIVLEIDGRLLAKSDFEKLRDNPIATFRKLLTDVDGTIAAQAVLYGFRMIRVPGGSQPDQMMQIVAKLPYAQRALVLEASGQTIMLARDFLDRGKNNTDTTVLPRFWNPTATERANMKIAAQGVEGLAGIVMTKRGLAPRIWVSIISQARAQLLPADNRLTKENMHVVPRHTLELAGWPAATAAEHVIASTPQAIKLAVVPLRVGGVDRHYGCCPISIEIFGANQCGSRGNLGAAGQ